MYTIADVNALSEPEFVNVFGSIYEHSPWVAKAAWHQLPVTSLDGLERILRQVVEQADDDAQIGILKAHPEFAGAEATDGTLTTASENEQGRLSLNRLPSDQCKRMRSLNSRFMESFGFPGIVAVRLHSTVESVFAELQRRVENDPDVEAQEAMTQVYHIVRFRLEDLIKD